MRNLYVILAAGGKGPKALGEKVAGLRGIFKDSEVRPMPGKRAWILCCDETIKTVAKHLGMDDEGRTKGVLLQVDRYSGWADAALWDWMKANWTPRRYW